VSNQNIGCLEHPCEHLISALSDPALVTDEAGLLVGINKAAMSLFNIQSIHSLIGSNVGLLFLGCQNGWPFTDRPKFQSSITGPNGRPIQVEVSLSPLILQESSFHLGIVRDITQFVLLREALREAETRLGEMVGNLPVTLFQMVLSEEGEVYFPYISSGVTALVGMDVAELMDNSAPILERMPETEKKTLYRAIIKSALNKTPLEAEFPLLLKDKGTTWVRFFANPRAFGNKSVIWDGAAIDVSIQHEMDERMRFLAYHDDRTKLANRLALDEYLCDLIKQEDRGDFAVLALAIDRLDLVNDTLGNNTADQLTLLVAEQLAKSLGQNAYLALLRADTFCIVLKDIQSDSELAVIANNLLKMMKVPFQIGARSLDVSISIGISVSNRDGIDAESLMMNADTALRRAHLTSPGGYRFYVEEMNTRALRVLAYENRLRKALLNNEFVPFFQPLIDMQTGQIAAMESLARWKHPRLGLVGPNEFIPVAEEAGLIGDICHHVLLQTCQTAKKWLDMGLKPVPLAVNISWRQFAQPERLLALMADVLKVTGLPAEMIELELTESSVMEEPDSAIRTLNDLREFGVIASIDDFGTGYSSLAYLKRLPISKLKIDRAFIHEIVENERDAAIVDAIIQLARALGLKTVAEGIETIEQFNMLKAKGCDLAQGFYFSKPVPAEDMEKIIRQGFFMMGRA
jgi:diguanylate cyclase (GGDEF)-like protein